MHVHSELLVTDLAKKARELRIQTLKMVFNAQSGHLGGSFSAAEIMAAAYFHHLRIRPKEPQWPDRDRLVVSKGHCAPIYYLALADAGFFPMEWLNSFRRLGTRLQGHPDRTKVPGVEVNSGPLGHGLSVGVGLALSGRVRRAPYGTYVLLGDGETQSGVVWEAAMAASKFRLEKLTAILDYNGVQLSGPVHEVMPIEPLRDKWEAFGWQVFEIDGHNVRQILDALDAVRGIHGKPSIIIAHTVKGKGVSFMEGNCAWHGKAPNQEQYEQALRELRNGDDR